MTAAELARDDEFRAKWPYIEDRLRKFLTQRQLDFSIKHKGQYELIGRYVEFQQDLFESLSELNALTADKPGGNTAPKRLNNVHFKQGGPPPVTPPTK